MYESLKPDEDRFGLAEETARDLVAHIIRMKTTGKEFHIPDGRGRWVVTVNFETTGSKPN
jgi:hypothetical protein